MIETIAYSFAIGTGATFLMDLWTIIRHRAFGIPPMNYGLVGRWLGHLTRGRFHHDAIGIADPIRREDLIGWSFHYLTGAAFAGILLFVWGLDWAQYPRITPALIVGLGTLAAPFLIMQPAMGHGIAASRAANPAAARFHSIVTHSVFGIGLYATAQAIAVSGYGPTPG